MEEVDDFTKQILARDPNTYDGDRLEADIHYTRATAAYGSKRDDAGHEELLAAIAEYRKADSIKSGQQGVSMQLARALAANSQFADSEQLYRRVIAKDKAYQYSYTELYRMFLFQAAVADRNGKPDVGKNYKDQAEQILKLGYQNNPKQYAFLTLLALHYYGERRTDEMVSVLQQIKSHAKDFEQAYLTVGDFYLRMGDGDSAIREYKEGITKDAKKKSTYQKRVIEVLMRQGKRREGAGNNAKDLEERPHDNHGLGLAATLLLERGGGGTARAGLQPAVAAA